MHEDKEVTGKEEDNITRAQAGSRFDQASVGFARHTCTSSDCEHGKGGAHDVGLHAAPNLADSLRTPRRAYVCAREICLNVCMFQKEFKDRCALTATALQ